MPIHPTVKYRFTNKKGYEMAKSLLEQLPEIVKEGRRVVEIFLNNSTWHGMAWHGMAWHGMAWHGMAWHGMAWQLYRKSSL